MLHIYRPGSLLFAEYYDKKIWYVVAVEIAEVEYLIIPKTFSSLPSSIIAHKCDFVVGILIEDGDCLWIGD